MATLGLAQFTQYTPTAGVNSMILSYKVPHNSVIYLRNDHHMNLKIPAFQQFTYSAVQSSDNVSVTVAAPVAIVPNVYNAPAYQLSALAYWETTSPSVSTNIVYPTSISGSNITFAVNDTTSTAATLNVYYLLGIGSFQWVIAYPSATGTTNAIIKTEAIEDINSRSQAAIDSQLYFPISLPLPQDFYLYLYVNSSVAANMTLNQNTTTPNLLAHLSIPIETSTMTQALNQDPQFVSKIKSYLSDVS